jgi:hypothetical protein
MKKDNINDRLKDIQNNIKEYIESLDQGKVFIKQQNLKVIYDTIEVIKNKNFYCEDIEFEENIRVMIRTPDKYLSLGVANFSKYGNVHRYSAAKEVCFRLIYSMEKNTLIDEIYSSSDIRYSDFDEFMKQMEHLAVQYKQAQMKIKQFRATMDFV